MVVDDHVIIRRGLRNLITSRISGAEVVDAPDLEMLLQELAKEDPPTIVILDLQLPDGNALDRLQELRAIYPRVRFLIYSMNLERIFGPRVLAMGCAGYLSKDSSEDEVIRALQIVQLGGTYIGTETEMRMLDKHGDVDKRSGSNPYERLSGRELRVLDELLSGIGVKEISVRMGLGISTVATYKARLFEKLGISNLMELQASARANGYRNS
jgi:DNA-binding NarL/FixJ family response regulator